jgi:hypothetical protein
MQHFDRLPMQPSGRYVEKRHWIRQWQQWQAIKVSFFARTYQLAQSQNIFYLRLRPNAQKMYHESMSERAPRILESIVSAATSEL